VSEKKIDSAFQKALFFARFFLQPEYLFLVVNFFIFCCSEFFGADRPVLVIEYLLVVMLWVLRLPRSAVSLFAAAYILDIYLVVYQVYPFEGLSQLLTLLSFLTHANTILIIQVSLCVFLLVSGAIILLRARPKNYIHLLPIFIAAFTAVVYMHIEKPLRTVSWKKNSDGIFSSVLAVGYQKRFEILYGEMKVNKVEPAVSSLSSRDQMDAENKTLFVMLESLGVFNNDALSSALLQELDARANKRSVTRGEIQFSGSTVNAELRELCGVTAESHMLLTETSVVNECFPNRFKSSIAIHAADDDMYDRNRFYPKLGFDVTKFKGSGLWTSKCFSFPGACDLEVINWMDERSAYIASFDLIYYLTLNSHYPYDVRDISESYLDTSFCKDFVLPEQVCRYFLLQKQTIDALARLLDNPDFKSYRVVLVGDHPPVITNLDAKNTYFKDQTVPYIILSAVRSGS